MSSPPQGARAELLERALELFAAYGYDGVGVQQICSAAGVAKPTLYHHFGSKRGLIERLMEERLAALYAALAAATAPEHDLAATLVSLAEATFAYAAAERTLYRLYLTLWFAPTLSEAYDVARGFHERQFAVVERAFRDAAQSDRALEGRARALAAAFLGLINTHIGLALNNYAGLNAKLAHATVETFLYGVTTPPERGAPKRRRPSAVLPIGI